MVVVCFNEWQKEIKEEAQKRILLEYGASTEVKRPSKRQQNIYIHTHICTYIIHDHTYRAIITT